MLDIRTLNSLSVLGNFRPEPLLMPSNYLMPENLPPIFPRNKSTMLTVMVCVHVALLSMAVQGTALVHKSWPLKTEGRDQLL